MISLGLDSGSSMTKAVLLEDTKIIDTKMIPTSISPRKSLEDLYREMKKQHKEIDVIVFKNSARLGRNQKEALDFVEYLEEQGVEIIFEDESKITRIDDLCFRNTPWEKDRAFDNDGICMVNGIVTGIYVGGDVVIPDGAKAISGRPFVNTDCGGDVTSITIPASVTSVSKLMNDVNENAVIKCTAGSAAEDYAKAKGLKYEIIG